MKTEVDEQLGLLVDEQPGFLVDKWPALLVLVLDGAVVAIQQRGG